MPKTAIITISVFSAIASGCSLQPHSVSQPQIFILGASQEEVRVEALKACESIQERDIVPITAPLAKESQRQIDCEGYLFAGKPRKVELVFQDDQLDLIWILIAEDEKEDITRAMSKHYGEPSMIIDYGAIYLQANAAVRNEPPEVLFASQRQVDAMLKILSEAK